MKPPPTCCRGECAVDIATQVPLVPRTSNSPTSSLKTSNTSIIKCSLQMSYLPSWLSYSQQSQLAWLHGNAGVVVGMGRLHVATELHAHCPNTSQSFAVTIPLSLFSSRQYTISKTILPAFWHLNLNNSTSRLPIQTATSTSSEAKLAVPKRSLPACTYQNNWLTTAVKSTFQRTWVDQHIMAGNFASLDALH